MGQNTAKSQDHIKWHHMLHQWCAIILFFYNTNKFGLEKYIVGWTTSQHQLASTNAKYHPDKQYLKRYTTALFKKQWGANLSKFNGVAMVGGVTLNGQQIYSEALQDVEKLETEIRSSFELNPAMLIG